ncbi:MAG: response regulator [Lachnospiraceae bacterium]|nr:response regulator [Lachnospiraceae bacterium]
MDELTVILVEDDPLTCANFVKCADAMDDISLVSVTNNATKALSDIQDLLPDAVILDLELHMGGGNGLDVLNGLNALNIHPYVIVTTNNSSRITFEFARQLGADFIMAKHQQDYSEQSVLNFLQMTKSVIKSNQNSARISVGEAPVHYKKRITDRITSELNLIGINPKATGYPYLVDAIILFAEQQTQNICTIIAEHHKKTEPSVERAMQNAINAAWKHTDIDELLTHYTAKIRSSKGSPTVTEFISYYANKIKQEYY